MTKNRRKNGASFKAKVALEAVREHESVATIAQRCKYHSNVVYKWKKERLADLERAFEKGETNHRRSSEREAELLKKIGELTIAQ